MALFRRLGLADANLEQLNQIQASVQLGGAVQFS